MKLNCKYLTLILCLFCFCSHAQEQVDFKASIASIDSLIQKYHYDSAVSEIYSLKASLMNTSVGKEDTVQLYFISKLAFLNFKLNNCDSAIVQGQAEANLRKQMYGEGNPQTLAALHNQGVYLLSCGDAAAAKDTLAKTIKLHQSHLDRVDQLLLLTLDDLAFSYGKLNEVDSAAYYYDVLIELLVKYTSKDRFYHHVIDNYSALLVNAERFEDAAQFYDDLKTSKQGSKEYPKFLKDYYNVFIRIPDYVKALETSRLLLATCKATDCAEIGFSEREFVLNAARLSVLLARYNDAMLSYESAYRLYSNDQHTLVDILQEQAEIAGILQNKHAQLRMLSLSKSLHREHNLTDSSSYAKTVFQLGNIYTELGKFEEADRLFQDYIFDLEKAENPDPKKLAQAYQSLGNQKYLMQNFKAADLNFNKARQILETNNLKSIKEYASLLNSMGALAEALANYDLAENSYRQALDIIAREPEKSQTLRIALASNLANVLMSTRPTSDSIKLLLDKAIDWQRESTGIWHPAYANLLGKRGLHLQEQQSFEEAREDYQDALDILKYTVGATHPEYLNLTSNLGLLYDKTEQYEEALSYMTEAKRLYDSLYTKDHPGYLLTINNLANLYTKMEKYDQAELLQLELATLQVEQIQESFSYLAENEKEKFMDEKRKFLDNFKRYIVSRGTADISSLSPKILTAWYDLELTTKGMLLNSTKRVRDQIFQSGNQELIHLFSEWTLTRKQIADMKSLTASQTKENNAFIDSLNQKIITIEKELSRKSAEFSSSFGQQSVTFEDIRSNLLPGEAAVEVIKIKLDSGSVYAALLVTNTSGFPDLTFLGKGEDLELKGYKFYKNAIQYKVADEASYKLFWKPLDKLLTQQGVKKLYYAPDGVYHRISLGTLYNPETKNFLLEDYQIVQLSSTKDLLSHSSANGTDPASFHYLLAGRPSYSYDGLMDSTNSIATRSFNMDNVTDLPGTEQEVVTITDMLKIDGIHYELLLHEQPTEGAIKQKLNSEVVHIATHGFFLDESNLKTTGPRLDPMLYSGLLFTGVSEEDTKQRTGEDGILTAYEIMNLELSNNKMVILSACETGLGEISAGEGIYGLQRAFFVAGTETIIMSLWKVDDAATRDLMTHFYKRYLKSGDKREAFADAQKKLMKQYKEPVYWGAFVMLGM